ncbi:MAG TPA: TetR family transcriptional regulator, partial [Pseudonocardia sp.]|nr:TetR family transcriptional regulator [Pseudonocardia sp.]
MTRRRGRRRSGEDTRAALLDAARAEFAEQGFDGATLRTIAARAGTDPAMVNHWFGGKQALFAAVMQIPYDVPATVAGVLDGPPDRVGERLVEAFLTVWDRHPVQLTALVRSVSTHPQAAAAVRRFLTRTLLERLVRGLDVDRPELRAALCASQMIGLAVVRFVVGLEPVAEADRAVLAAAVGPTLQRYLTGDLGTPDAGYRPGPASAGRPHARP